ncbi:NAD(P)H-binding protein [Enterococcus sp. LJL120]
MKIFIVGAAGRVAEELIADLIADGHEVLAGARSPEKIKTGAKITPVHFDLHWEVAEMAIALAGAEVVYFVAGSRGQDLLQTDLFGAVKLMQAAETQGIKRYIQLSSTYSMEPEKWRGTGLEKIMNYNIAKMFADHWLVDNTQLDYTILQPGSLEETAATGKISVNSGAMGPNPIPDVAKTLAELLKYPNTIKKVISMMGGSDEIDEALKTL